MPQHIHKKKILITGGSGLIGRLLTDELLKKGYAVSHLSRKTDHNAQVSTFLWDVDKGIIDARCIAGVDIIVHLAGAGIADKRWTRKRKKEIIESRTKSIALIYNLLQNTPNQVVKVISASGIGYYSDRGDELMTEQSSPANDFLAECCIAWENAVDEGNKLGLAILKFRTGVVLHHHGGALPAMALPVKFYVGAPIGSGKQWISWIHWQDVIGMYIFGIENDGLRGVYNMASAWPVTNKTLTQAIARQLRKPLWLPKVPAFVLKLLLGEMSTLVLGSTKVSPQKITTEGFQLRYTDLTGALKEIYG